MRRLVLIGVPAARLPKVTAPVLLMRTRLESGAALDAFKAAVPHAKFEDIPDYSDDVFDVQPKTLARRIGAFLSGRP